jgi:hypothetical protein
MTELKEEPRREVRAYRVPLKGRTANVRDNSVMFRGFGRVKEADGRKSLAFSTLSASVLQLMGAIHDGHQLPRNGD